MDLGIAPGNDTVGAKIVAPHDGKIYYTSNRHGYSDCHDIGFQATQNGKPIAIFGMLHNGEIMVTQGQEVKVGEVIGLMGPNKCADDSTPHLHFDKSTSATVDNTGDYDNGRDPDLAKLINKLYENLPKV
jgi:murein DD-endopeptidase MepM/ murein hydrolase activator NlpD